ncbi:MAG: TIGR01777 family oxidoreductase [Gemmatimonadota bacterium]|nr:TIGR01777 family oxidoreductase [Gemmatimonadota bacterium]MDE3171630.1 TIGR01777 family oxidoreductase [Gemmatimonadota bacterium]
MQIAISGASGFLGRSLAARLRAAGHAVRPLVRTASQAGAGPAGAIFWDPEAGVLDPAALSEVGAVIHLAAEPIDHRWTRERRRVIRESRVRGTETIARAIAAARRPGMVLLSASAVGIYGDRGDEVLDERSGLGRDFLAGVATEWERATDPARDSGVRVVQLRTGVVLAPDGGALARMLPLFRVGLGGPLGSGRQWMSWIAREDFTRAVLFLLGAPEAAGPLNLVAPHPVRNAEFARELGRALARPALLPAPAAALQLVFGDMARGALLASQRALPRRLGELGFQFRLPLLADALAFELGRDG